MNNLTNFKDFKKIYEFQEMTNKTTWSESMLGKAVNGIFGGIFSLFRKGADIGKLELFKQDLINEYMAGVFRGLKENDMIKKNEKGEWFIGGGEVKTEGTEETDDVKDYLDRVDILSPYEELKRKINSLTELNDENKKFLSDTKTQLENEIKGSGDVWGFEKIIRDMNSQLNNIDTQIKNITADKEKKEKLEKVKEHILSDLNVAKEEQKVLTNLIKMIDDKLNKKTTTPIVESYNYEGYDMLNEDLGDKPVRLGRILGDVLQDFSNFDIRTIDTVELTKIFQSNTELKKSCTNFVNKNKVKAINLSATNTYTKKEKGSTYGAEDPSLKNRWLKNVEYALSLFRNFLSVAPIDPTNSSFRTDNDEDVQKYTEMYGKQGQNAENDVKMEGSLERKSPTEDNGGIMRFTSKNFSGNFQFINLKLKDGLFHCLYFIRTIKDFEGLSDVISKDKSKIPEFLEKSKDDELRKKIEPRNITVGDLKYSGIKIFYRNTNTSFNTPNRTKNIFAFWIDKSTFYYNFYLDFILFFKRKV